MRKLLLPLLLNSLVATTSVAAPSQLSISLSTATVRIDGATPGTSLLLFSVANEPAGYYNAVVRREELITADRSGAAEVQLQEPLPRRSVWFAVNVRTGEYAVATPSRFPRLATLVAPHALPDAMGIERLAIVRDYVEVAVIRPGTGVWVDSLSKGGPKDTNKGGGPLHATISSFKSLDKSTRGPDHLTPADLLIIVDPHTLQYYVASELTT